MHLPRSEAELGWDAQRAQNWLAAFSNVRRAVAEGNVLGPNYGSAGFLRALDMDGICGGEVFEMAVALERELRELVAAQSED